MKKYIQEIEQLQVAQTALQAEIDDLPRQQAALEAERAKILESENLDDQAVGIRAGTLVAKLACIPHKERQLLARQDKERTAAIERCRAIISEVLPRAQALLVEYRKRLRERVAQLLGDRPQSTVDEVAPFIEERSGAGQTVNAAITTLVYAGMDGSEITGSLITALKQIQAIETKKPAGW